MRRFTTQLLTGLLAVIAAVTAPAFSLLGPYQSWQTTALGYQLVGDVGGPMGLFEDYRWNITNVYYAVDGSFLDYFGLQGAQEIDKAFAVLNALPPVSSLSTNLTEYPQTDVQRQNYRAMADRILDVKSVALHIMMEEMGLADPVRYNWTLRGRNEEVINGLNQTNYAVVKRNFDPVNFVPSSFVNGALFSYDIRDPIQSVGNPDYADAVERALDPTYANGYPWPVASGRGGPGLFYIGLSRDDVGGLRWLLRTGNFNTETGLSNNLVAAVNRQTQLILTNQDWRAFTNFTVNTTNEPAAVLTNYPDLILTSTNSRLVVMVQTNRYWVLTNDVYSPTGHMQFVLTNYTTNVVMEYNYTYKNVVTNGTNIGPGGFYIIPPNLLSNEPINNLFTNVVPVTNLIWNPSNYYVLETNVQMLITNHDITLFTLRTANTTNDPATLLTYYPDLVVTNTNSYFSIITATNVVAYFKDAPFAPHQTLLTNVTTNVVARYQYGFANAFTNVLLSVPIETNGEIVYAESTNVFILPTNYVGYQIVSNLFFQTITNVVTNTVPGPGFYIDYGSPVAFGSTNLALFNEQARTNSATNLMTIYPALVVTNTAYTIGVQAFTNYYYDLTNPPFAPAGALVPVFYPVVTNILVTNYTHHFANVITNNYYANAPLYLRREEVYLDPFGTAGSGLLATNVTLTPNGTTVNGSVYFIPTNLVGYVLIDTLLTNTMALTNDLQPFFSTNFAGTNVISTNLVATNIVYTNLYLVSYGTDYIFSAYQAFPDPGTNYYSFYTNLNMAVYGITGLTNGTNSGSQEYAYTNIISAVYPIEFQTNANNVAIRPGVEKVTFHNVQANFDSYIGQFFRPFTNEFTETFVTNHEVRSQVVRRILGAPDILFVSEDLGLENGLVPWAWRRTGATNWINNDALNGSSTLGGPGVIAPPIRISFTDQYPYYINTTPNFLNELTAERGLVWGSFDGTTNAPVVYPNYISLQELETRILTPPEEPPP